MTRGVNATMIVVSASAELNLRSVRAFSIAQYAYHRAVDSTTSEVRRAEIVEIPIEQNDMQWIWKYAWRPSREPVETDPVTCF